MRAMPPQDRMPPGVTDRTVRITGQDVEQLMRAVALILTKLVQVPRPPLPASPAHYPLVASVLRNSRQGGRFIAATHNLHVTAVDCAEG